MRGSVTIPEIVAVPPESAVSSFKVALAGPWLAATDVVNPLGQFTPRQRLHQYDARVTDDPLLPFHSHVMTSLPAHLDAECSVANSIVLGLCQQVDAQIANSSSTRPSRG